MMTSSSSCQWSAEENKLFENALAEFDEDTPDRWEKVAARVPEKTVAEVVKQYQRLVEDVELIESGVVPLPHYPEDNNYGGGSSDSGSEGVVREEKEEEGKEKKQRGRNTPVRRKKKGVPWNEEEHRLFLMGLSKYGKGDWRSISRNCVLTRTPTQVASHAQKYFNRLNNPAKKESRRPSINDIKTVDASNSPTAQPSNIQHSHTPAVGLDSSTFFPSSASKNSCGTLGSSVPVPPVGAREIAGQSSCPHSLSVTGFEDLPMGNLRVGGFGNFTTVNFRDGPAYSLYDLPALQRR